MLFSSREPSVEPGPLTKGLDRCVKAKIGVGIAVAVVVAVADAGRPAHITYRVRRLLKMINKLACEFHALA